MSRPRRNVRQQGGGGGDGGGESGGEGLTRRYDSFEEFASEQYAKLTNNETLDVPIVASPDGPEASRSIPAAIIIGVQVGGKGYAGCPPCSGS